MVTGLGALRNYSGLFYLQGSFMSDVFSSVKKKWIKMAVFALTLLGTIGGLYNVVTHQNTTKNQWNLPHAEIIDCIHEQASDSGSTLILSKDSVLLYYLRNEGYNTVLFQGYQWFEQQQLDPNWEEKLKSWNGTVIAITTFDPSDRANDEYAKYLEYVEEIKTHSEHYEFGYDRYAWFKRHLDKNICDYGCELYIY